MTRIPGTRLSVWTGLIVLTLALAPAWALAATTPQADDPATRDVIFVGNNWDGTINVIDAESFDRLGVINGVPDKRERLKEIRRNPIDFLFFQAVRYLIGEGHDQLVDDMYSSPDGRLLVVSRPSFADVVALDMESGEVAWRFEVDGNRSDHMAISPDGTEVAVSASTGNVVHILDIETGEERGKFPSGDSPHENVYSADGDKIYHASIGYVYTPLDRGLGTRLKGERVFQVVDADSLEVLEQFDFGEKLAEAGYPDLSPAVRPMAHTPDEKMFYFQLSFHHGFVEYDMEADRVTRVAQLPNLVPDIPLVQYVNDSAHHGIAMSGDGETLCVAGTMSDYAALVSRETFEFKLLKGLGKKPYWATSDADGEHCYISWSETDQMSVISYETGEEVVRLDVGNHPQRIREGRVREGWVAPQ